jgi:hypothetical protein
MTCRRRLLLPDEDSDGFGATPRACSVRSVPIGDVGGDCDDVDGDINPNAQEICDDKDNDCDTLTDDDDSDTYGQLEYKVDADGDGWGDEKASPERYCADPGSASSYDATTAQDCDDANPSSIRTPEFCSDTEYCIRRSRLRRRRQGRLAGVRGLRRQAAARLGQHRDLTASQQLQHLRRRSDPDLRTARLLRRSRWRHVRRPGCST